MLAVAVESLSHDCRLDWWPGLHAARRDRRCEREHRDRRLPDGGGAGTIDHFTCYEVFRAEGTRIETETVELRDELGMQSFRVTRPDELCAPADKNGETPGAETHAAHLLCYVLRRTGPRLTPPTVFATDQFASRPVDLLTTKQRLCVPSTKVVVP